MSQARRLHGESVYVAIESNFVGRAWYLKAVEFIYAFKAGGASLREDIVSQNE